MGIYGRTGMLSLSDEARRYIGAVLDQFVCAFTEDVCPVHVVRLGLDDAEIFVEPEDERAALLAPCSVAAVVADICQRLEVEMPELVKLAIGEGCPLPLPAA